MALPKPRPHIQKIADYVAGRSAKDFGKNKFQAVKLSSNEAVWGAGDAVIDALRRQAATAHLYPESQCFSLREKLSEFVNINPENIILGNGSNEIIQFILFSYASPNENIIVPKLTFSMYKIYAQIANVKIREVANLDNFDIDLEKIKKNITSRTKAIFIANPNNPTGLILNKMSLELFLMGMSKDILVIIDEAYADFTDSNLKPDFISMIKSGKYPNLIVLRTFSKAFGMAGLRLGYGIGTSAIISNLMKVAQPFNVNSMAVAGALESLNKISHYNSIVKQTIQGKTYLERKLKELGCIIIPSEANFLMIKVKNVKKTVEFLADHGIIVRDLTSFGLNDYIRVTVGNHDLNRKFINAFSELNWLKKNE